VLSQTCEYALRAATYIARHGEDDPVLAKEIAENTRVPLKYLQKVLRDLVRGGVLVSARGIGGGFRLSRPPAKVRLAEVLAPFDDAGHRLSCPFGNPACGGSNPCPVHNKWKRVVECYSSFLEHTTLGHLISGEPFVPGKRSRQHRSATRRGGS
jgi:Rrf2 family iron-sulfur cluster assembly transcriptional regulator